MCIKNIMRACISMPQLIGNLMTVPVAEELQWVRQWRLEGEGFVFLSV